jgi:hypothetical protein
MSDLIVTIPHQLGREGAKCRIQEQVAVVRHQRGSMLGTLQENWAGDTMAFSLSAMGQSLSGRLTVAEHAVHLTVALPWFLRMLAGKVKSALEQQGRLLLASNPAAPSP